MIESGVIKYGDEFLKEHGEPGIGTCRKVDMDEVEKSQVAMVFGQMNEPPGARSSVALSGLTLAESFRDNNKGDGPRDILFFIDNIFRFHPGRFRSVRPVGTYALGRGLSADTGFRNGTDARTNHVHEERFYHVCTGRVCACRRLDRPCTGHDIHASWMPRPY